MKGMTAYKILWKSLSEETSIEDQLIFFFSSNFFFFFIFLLDLISALKAPPCMDSLTLNLHDLHWEEYTFDFTYDIYCGISEDVYSIYVGF